MARDESTSKTYEWFLMEFCGLDRLIGIRILNIDIKKQEISYMLKIPNAPGEYFIVQSLKGIRIDTYVQSEQAAKLVVKDGFKENTVERNPARGAYENLNWEDLSGALTLKVLYLSLADYERLFPKA